MHADTLVSVVDDDPSVRKALGRLLASVGFQVRLYGSSEEFLESQNVSQTDCLILDVHLPGMNGLELQELLLFEHRACPILFITAFDDRAAEQQALRRGAIAFLGKPLDTDYLVQLIESVSL